MTNKELFACGALASFLALGIYTNSNWNDQSLYVVSFQGERFNYPVAYYLQTQNGKTRLCTGFFEGRKDNEAGISCNLWYDDDTSYINGQSPGVIPEVDIFQLTDP
jgi:hypothetical protein